MEEIWDQLDVPMKQALQAVQVRIHLKFLIITIIKLLRTAQGGTANHAFRPLERLRISLKRMGIMCIEVFRYLTGSYT